MDNEIKTSGNSTSSIRIFGNVIVAIGVVILLFSQFMETTVAPDYANLDIESIKNLPEKVVNFDLIAQKLNFLILGGILILIGLKLSLISNETIETQKEQTNLLKIISEKIQRNTNVTIEGQNENNKDSSKSILDRNLCPVCQTPIHKNDKNCSNCGIVVRE